MKRIKYFLLVVMTVLAGGMFTACTDDANDWSDGTPRQWSPIQVTVSAGDTYAVLSKFYAAGATGYVVQVATDENFTENMMEFSIPKVTSEETYEIAGLTPSTEYYLRIKAVGDGKEDSRWLVYSKYSNTDGYRRSFNTKSSGESADTDE